MICRQNSIYPPAWWKNLSNSFYTNQNHLILNFIYIWNIQTTLSSLFYWREQTKNSLKNKKQIRPKPIFQSMAKYLSKKHSPDVEEFPTLLTKNIGEKLKNFDAIKGTEIGRLEGIITMDNLEMLVQLTEKHCMKLKKTTNNILVCWTKSILILG